MATATKPRKKTRRKSESSSPTVIVTIAMFDASGGSDVYRPLRSGQPVEEFVPLGPGDYNPRGGTPLHDATAQFIAHLESQRRPGTVVIGALADESGSMSGNRQSVVDIGHSADELVDPRSTQTPTARYSL